jgi:hypothetical protein
MTVLERFMQYPFGAIFLAIVVVFLIGFITWVVWRAFKEGREIIIWPMKLGEPPPATPDSGATENRAIDSEQEKGLVSVVPLSKQSSRNRERLAERLQNMRSSDTVKFISITSKWLFEPQTFQSSTNSPIQTCLETGATIKGVLLEPTSGAARLRIEIESPQKSYEEAMLTKHSEFVKSQVADLSRRFSQRLEVRRFGQWITFQLWLLPDVAIIEPYHIGQIKPNRDENPLCGFSHIHLPDGTKEYQALNLHFEEIWKRAVPIEPANP